MLVLTVKKRLLSGDEWHRRTDGQMLPRMGSAKQKPKEEENHSETQGGGGRGVGEENMSERAE